MATVTGLAFAAPAQASVIVTIDPDGPGPQGPIQVGVLDWNVSNSLIQNIASGTSQSYAQANLGNFDNPGPISGTGLNTNYEWTYNLGFLNSVSQTCSPNCTSPTSISRMSTSIAGGDNFFRIFFDPSKDSNPLAGTGYTNGTLILEGSVQSGGVNTFTAQNITGICSGVGCPGGIAPGQTIPLDNFGTNNYPDISSVTGTGGGEISIKVTFANPAFFLTNPVNLAIDFTTQNVLPFGQTDPSLQFTDGAGHPVNGATIASIGNCNGCLGSHAGPVSANNPPNTAPNLMLQGDANNSFFDVQQTVPEPSAVLLVGPGLGLLMTVRAVRRRRS